MWQKYLPLGLPKSWKPAWEQIHNTSICCHTTEKRVMMRMLTFWKREAIWANNEMTNLWSSRYDPLLMSHWRDSLIPKTCRSLQLQFPEYVEWKSPQHYKAAHFHPGSSQQELGKKINWINYMHALRWIRWILKGGIRCTEQTFAIRSPC